MGLEVFKYYLVAILLNVMLFSKAEANERRLYSQASDISQRQNSASNLVATAMQTRRRVAVICRIVCL